MGTTITATRVLGPACRPGIGTESKYTLLLDTTDGSGLMTCDLTDDYSYLKSVKIGGSLASTGYVVEVQKPAVTALAAQGTATLTGVPTADDTIVLDGTTITFKADGSGDVDHCTIGVSAAATITNLVTTLGECTGNDVWDAEDGAGDTLLITAATAGEAGDAIVFTESAANLTIDGGGTLGGTRAGKDANEALSATNLVFGFYEAGVDGAPLDAVATTDLSTTITGLTVTVIGQEASVTSWA
ncbi:MAG: hypothetical protein GY854_01805 [Deltaproteobacteria bacterium]|nr:hypothetical protein [Deltaproteobacteria bacterium]